MIRIALDAMGGDLAPRETVAGAASAVADWDDLSVSLVGDEASLRRELSHQRARESDRLGIVHAPEAIGMGEHAAEAVRRKKGSSINVSVKLVADGKADAAVSAGNTGAMVAASTLFLRLLPGVRRPGIAVTLPTRAGRTLLVDAGANIYAKPEHLSQYALMASVFCEEVWGARRPTVGLLNVGEEEGKGNELVSAAAELLRAAPIHYKGFAEGNDIFAGKFDVIVCEGFVGNVVLKVSEGLAETILHEMKQHLTATPLVTLGALLCKPGFRKLKKRMDYAEYGGAPLLGAAGVSVIAHGRSNARAIRNALGVAREWSAKRVNEKIVKRMESALEKA